MNFSSETRVKDMALSHPAAGRVLEEAPGRLLLRERKISPESLRYN